MPSLYELTGERLALKNKLEGLDFDVETIADTLEGDSTALQVKIESYGFVIREMESFADMIKLERDRLDKRLKVHESKVGHIKDWLMQNMLACEIIKIECAAFTISLQNNPASVVIDAESLIPEGYMRLPEPIPLVPNKKLIGDAIKSGLTVDGAHLEQTKRLVIK